MIKRLRRIGELLWESGPIACLGLFALTLFSGVLPAAQLWVGKLIIDTVVQAATRIDGEALTGRAFSLVGLELALFATSAAIQTGNSLLSEIYGEKLTFQINGRILRKADELDLTYFEDPKFYDSLQRAQREAGYRPLSLLGQFLGITQSLIGSISLIVLLVRLGWFVVPILLVASIPLFISTVKFARTGYLLVQARTPEARQMSYIKSLMGTDQAAKEVKLFGLGPHLIERFQELFETVHRETLNLAFRKGGARILGSIVNSTGYAGLYSYLVWLALRHLLSIGDLTLYAGAVLQLNRLLQSLLEDSVRFYQNYLFIDDLFSYLDLQPRTLPVSNPIPVPTVLEEGFRLEAVSFAYPGSEKNVLENVSFSLKPGQSTALVGENGSGKTTLVKLLCGLYAPTAGRIFLEGRELREYDPHQLREMIGVVFQDFVRYHATASDNIGYGRVEDLEDVEQIALAAERSGAQALIDSLPQNYSTMLGKWFREGQDLSGGQWQKIALARAYMRDAPVIVLDEPTAALDARAEHEVFARFRDLRQGKIALLISHRFSTVITADQIVVLEQGKVLEIGNHRTLMQLNGRYSELFTLQAEAYQPQV
jgi:ATP-binding cassette, subfamily B, bacterial